MGMTGIIVSCPSLPSPPSASARPWGLCCLMLEKSVMSLPRSARMGESRGVVSSPSPRSGESWRSGEMRRRRGLIESVRLSLSVSIPRAIGEMSRPAGNKELMSLCVMPGHTGSVDIWPKRGPSGSSRGWNPSPPRIGDCRQGEVPCKGLAIGEVWVGEEGKPLLPQIGSIICPALRRFLLLCARAACAPPAQRGPDPALPCADARRPCLRAPAQT
mmetsp:Transcript_9068/g.22708  ORF Transcript_9068/g.22708 Transcript_9068/m.22708 type:complete len:216 (-) Transcript_9068:166-813(-)